MKISIINGDGTTTYVENMTPVTSLEEFSDSLTSATQALNDSQTETNATFAGTSLTVPTDLMNLLTAIAKQESNFTADATSSSGAMGIMQLMPATAQGLGVSNAYDPYQNIMGGAKYISQLLSRYDGDVSLALAAYNAGSGNVAKYGGIPPFAETQNYVSKVLGYYQNGVDIPSQTSSAQASATDTEGLSADERQNIYRQMLSLTNQLILDKLEA